MNPYVGMVSSDWSQCLSPNGPYDAFVFHYPQIEMALKRLFRSYTANEISLRQASNQVKKILPAPLTVRQMDCYLEARFDVYLGVAELLSWCRRHGVLFMINTTGFMGYFQRIRAMGLLPPFSVLSAQSMLRFSDSPNDPKLMIDLDEIDDKAANTATIAKKYHISPNKMILLGDSGGDGPHFKWGAGKGATLIGSMTKPTLSRYCQENDVLIDHYFGYTYSNGDKISSEKENDYDFRKLTAILKTVLAIK